MTDEIRLRLKLHRGDFRLRVDATLPGHGMIGIFGESGAGKTTLLRCVAGLEFLSDGFVSVRGTTWRDSAAGIDVPVHKRSVACVFQEPRLFTHTTVAANLRYAEKRSHSKAVSFERAVELLSLSDLLARSAGSLSGGEAKRVAIARALLRSPDLLLMDEPLASLDARRQRELIPYLDRLHAELTMPVLYVSHSIDEIAQLCDQLVVLEGGAVLANDALQDVLIRTDIELLAGSEAGVVLETRQRDIDVQHGLTRLELSAGELWVASPVDSVAPRVRIRANDVSLCRTRPSDSSILNILAARIDEIAREEGASVLVHLSAGDDRLLARITQRSLSELSLKPGDDVFAQVKTVAVKRGFD